MNLNDVKHLTIDGKSAVRLSVGDNVLWKGLPEGYTRLGYIESTGNSYIDTGFCPTSDTRVVCEFMHTSTLSTVNSIYGGRRSIEKDNFSFRVSANRWQPCYNNEYGTFTDVPVDKEWHTADQNKNNFCLDGVLRNTCTYAEFTSPVPLTIGSIKGNAGMYDGYARFRYFRIYDNGVLVRDFIPCKNADGEIGMYDTLNAVFYGNAGSGEFVAGEAV